MEAQTIYKLYAARTSWVLGNQRNTAVFNPHAKPISALPTIYAFNQGGLPNWLTGVLIAEDGTYLGGNCSREEKYMPGNLGVLDGARLDLHEEFRAHYPDGYKMEFVGSAEVQSHDGLRAAIEKAMAAEQQGAAA